MIALTVAVPVEAEMFACVEAEALVTGESGCGEVAVVAGGAGVLAGDGDLLTIHAASASDAAAAMPSAILGQRKVLVLTLIGGNDLRDSG